MKVRQDSGVRKILAGAYAGLSKVVISVFMTDAERDLFGSGKAFITLTETHPPRHSDTEHHFLVTIKGCTEDQARIVIADRISYEEDNGFPYKIDYRVAL